MNAMQLILQAIELGLDKNPRVMALINCVARNPDDEDNVERLSRIITPVIVNKKMFGKPYKEANELVNGEIKIGATEQGLPVGVNLDEPHILVAGQTGSGKSVLLMLILSQVIMKEAREV